MENEYKDNDDDDDVFFKAMIIGFIPFLVFMLILIIVEFLK